MKTNEILNRGYIHHLHGNYSCWAVSETADTLADIRVSTSTLGILTEKCTGASVNKFGGAWTAISFKSINGDVVFDKAAGIGIKVGLTTPTFAWRDLRSNLIPKTTGTGAPTLDTFRGGVRGFRYSVGDDCDDWYHFDHDLVPSSDVYGHFHWAHNGTAISGVISALCFLTYAKGHNQGNYHDPVIIPISYNTVNITTTPQYRHRIEEVQFSAANGIISSAINVSITSGSATLTSASSLFSSTDVGRTVRIVGAGVAGADLDTTIQAYTSATQVTLANTASTTITTLPNYRLRVLDSLILEPDGLVKIHFDLVTIPTITGGIGNEPFIDFLDLHYLSTGIGTAQKSPNFYA